MCVRDNAAITAIVVSKGDRQTRTYGGVLLTEEPRDWEFENTMPPKEIRIDVGFGFFLHWACRAGDDSRAMISPCALEVRTKDNISKNLEDMTADYYKGNLFGLGLIQAPDIRKPKPAVMLNNVFRMC